MLETPLPHPQHGTAFCVNTPDASKALTATPGSTSPSQVALISANTFLILPEIRILANSTH